MIRRAAGDAWDGAWESVDLREEPVLPAAGEWRGVIVSGSAARLSEDTPWMRQGLAYLAELTRAQVPVLGICFGHQMLGAALGGHVETNPRGREIGTVGLTLEVENPLLNASSEHHVNATHLDSVLRLPTQATRYATTELEPNALVHFGARAWGVQFHPEMDREIIRCYIHERRDVLAQEGLDPAALSDMAHDAETGAEVIPNFVERVVGTA